MTAAQLKHIIPTITDAHLATYTPLLNKYMDQYEINSKARIAPFIANIVVESDRFNATKEYASGEQYEGRKDLGNEMPGDGNKFVGRGLIQITGHSMYLECSEQLFNDGRLINFPELLEHPDLATQSACWFWSKVKGLNVIADKPEDWTRLSKNGHTYTKFQWIVRLINGGQNALAARELFLKRANEIL